MIKIECKTKVAKESAGRAHAAFAEAAGVSDPGRLAQLREAIDLVIAAAVAEAKHHDWVSDELHRQHFHGERP